MPEKKTRSLKVNAILNVLKQCCTIVFPLIIYPYISRVIGKTNLGRYSFANSIIQYFIIFASVGIPTYAIRECSKIRDVKNKLNNLTAQLMTINLITMLLSYSGLILVTIFVPRIREEWILIAILAINVFANTFGRDWVNTVFEDFLYITIRYILFQIISFVCIFLFIKDQNDYIKYAIIMVLAYSGGYITNIFYTQKYVSISFTNKIDWNKHLKPILLLFSSTLAINIYVNSDITILGFFRPSSDVGVYTVVSKIYSTVKSLLNAVITVAIPRLSNYYGIGEFKRYNDLLTKLRFSLLTIIFPAIVGMISLSKDIMLLMGGSDYVSGTFALIILSIALFCAVFGCFYTQAILIPCNQENIFTIATIISALTNIGLNFIAVPLWGIYGAALTTLIAEFFILLISFIKSKGYHENFSHKGIVVIGIGCLVVFLACGWVKTLGLSLILEVLLSVLLSVFAYIVILVIGKNEIALAVIKKVRHK